MKRFFKWLGVIVLLLAIVYLAGPKPPTPQLNGTLPAVTQNLAALETEINRSEEILGNVKPDNQARIVWADSTRKRKTPFSIVYLHGFGASQAEGAPVHAHLARRYGCNLYLARLQDHGTTGDSVFLHLTPENYLASAKRALAIGQILGEKVIVVGTSAGGALSLYLAANQPAVHALVLYSPAVELYSKSIALIDKPWGKQLMRTLVGSDYVDFPRRDSLQGRYWLNRYRIEGLVTLQTFLDETMNRETFANVKCPVYLAYYHKTEEQEDKVVSVPAMLQMFGELGTPATAKRRAAFPNTGHHVIASYIHSKDWRGVETDTQKFLEQVVGLQPVALQK